MGKLYSVFLYSSFQVIRFKILLCVTLLYCLPLSSCTGWKPVMVKFANLTYRLGLTTSLKVHTFNTSIQSILYWNMLRIVRLLIIHFWSWILYSGWQQQINLKLTHWRKVLVTQVRICKGGGDAPRLGATPEKKNISNSLNY